MSFQDIKDSLFSVVKTMGVVDFIDILLLTYIVYLLLKLIRETAAVLPDRTNPEASQHLKESKAEETIICWLLKHPENVIDISNKAPPDIFVTHFNKKIYTGLINKMTEYNMFTISMLSDEFSIEELGEISGMEAKKRDIDITADVFADCINILQNYHKNPHKTNGEDLSDEDLLKLFQSKAKKQ